MPGQFDVIISSMALHYIDDYATVVKTMAEIPYPWRELSVFHRASDLYVAAARLGAR